MLRHKEMLRAIAGLTLSSCDPQGAPDSESQSGVETTRADVSATLKWDEDQAGEQLTGECTPEGRPLSGEQFPMLRGTKLIKTLKDGTCLERARNGDDYVVYAISGNSKIKFANPSPDQEARILAQNNFDELRELAIKLMEEIQSQALEVENRTEWTRSLISEVKNPEPLEKPRPLRVLFEGPMDECPTIRYRRVMLADISGVMGSECTWDERQNTCPVARADKERDNFQAWFAYAENGQHVIPKRGTAHHRLSPGPAPKPAEWLGGRPKCPQNVRK